MALGCLALSTPFVVRCGSKKTKGSASRANSGSSASTSRVLQKFRKEAVTLESIPKPLVDRSPSVALAFTFLGDAVWELYARQHMILKRVRSEEMSNGSGKAIRPQDGVSKGWCSAKAMCGHLNRLIEMDVLTHEELAVLKWGRDFGHESRPGHKGDVHRDASALEALVAWLYLFDIDRLHQVLDACGMTICGQPLQGLVGVSDAVLEAMEPLKAESKAP